MKKLYSLSRCFIMVIIFCQFSLRSSAQQNKFTGFIIDIKGDTTKGSFPQYRQWTSNPDRIMFISFQTHQEIILTPSVCKEFHIDGYETYISFHGERMINSMDFYRSDAGDHSDKYDTISTFLRQFAIIDSLKFYIFKDAKRFNLYYSMPGGAIIELLQKMYVAENHLIQSIVYKQQLQLLFPGKSEEINRLLYSEESLATFIRNQKKATVMIRKEQGNGGFYVSGGVSINSLKFTPDLSMNFSEKEFQSSQVPLVSIGYIFPFSRNFSRVFFLPQIKIFSFKHTAHMLYNDAYPVHSTTFRSSPEISLGFHFGYNIINHPDLQVSVAPGAGINFLTKFEQIDNYKFSSTNSSTVVAEMENLKPLIDLQATVIIKKRYVIWSAYNFPTHITIYPSVKDKFTSTQLGVGYKFK